MRSSSLSWSSRSRGSSHLNVGLRSFGFIAFSGSCAILLLESRPIRPAPTRSMARMKRLAAEELWKLERPAQPTLSPDGAQACVSVQSFDMETNLGRSSLWLCSTFGGEPRQLTTAGEKDAEPRWSPDGRGIAFVA